MLHIVSSERRGLGSKTVFPKAQKKRVLQASSGRANSDNSAGKPLPQGLENWLFTGFPFWGVYFLLGDSMIFSLQSVSDRLLKLFPCSSAFGSSTYSFPSRTGFAMRQLTELIFLIHVIVMTAILIFQLPNYHCLNKYQQKEVFHEWWDPFFHFLIHTPISHTSQLLIHCSVIQGTYTRCSKLEIHFRRPREVR